MITDMINVFSNLHSYINIGLFMFVAGLLLLVIGLISLVRYMGRSWEVSVTEFNQRFIQETGVNPGRIDMAGERLDIARQLHIDSIPKGVSGDLASSYRRKHDSGKVTEIIEHAEEEEIEMLQVIEETEELI